MLAVFLYMRVLPMPIKSFLPCDVTCGILEPRPSAILSHGGQRSCIKLLKQRAWE